jgi:RNA polymerase sigma-70 factor (ECF subfamily)
MLPCEDELVRNFTGLHLVIPLGRPVLHDDAVLIQMTVGGDRAAFGVLVRRHQDRLFNTVSRLLGNTEDAADVVQDAFLNAFVSLGAFKGDAKFFTWLYRIAVNSAISMKRRKRYALSVDSPGLASSGPEPTDESESSRPELALERAEDVERIQSALNRLTPEHRAVLVLKEIDGQKYEAIAELLQVPIGTIRSRLHRARLELRDRLAEDSANA